MPGTIFFGGKMFILFGLSLFRSGFSTARGLTGFSGFGVCLLFRLVRVAGLKIQGFLDFAALRLK